MFVTHRASRQGNRGQQGTRAQVGSVSVKPFLTGDQKILDHGNTKKRRLTPATVGNDGANGLVIQGSHETDLNQGTDPDSATPPLNGDSARSREFPVTLSGAYDRLAFRTPLVIPTIIGDVHIKGKVYSNGSELGGASAPAILNINSTSTSVSYEAASGTTVGTLSAVGGTAPIVFSIIADPDSKFALSGTNNEVLETNATFNYFTAQSHSVTIRATDVNLQTFDKAFTITLTVPSYTSTNCIEYNAGATTDEYHSRVITGEDLDFTSEFTVSYWINCANTTGFSHIAIADDPVGNYKFWIFNNGTGGDTLRMQIRDASSNLKDFSVVNGGVDWSDSTWHHICITYVTNSQAVYIDGVSKTFSYFTNNTLTSPLLSAGDVMIAQRPPLSSASGNFEGKMDEITFWDVGMSSAEVSELYNSGSQNFHAASHTRFDRLVAWYRFESLDVSGNATDSGPNGYTLTGANVDDSTNIVAV